MTKQGVDVIQPAGVQADVFERYTHLSIDKLAVVPELFTGLHQNGEVGSNLNASLLTKSKSEDNLSLRSLVPGKLGNPFDTLESFYVEFRQAEKQFVQHDAAHRDQSAYLPKVIREMTQLES